MSNFDTKPIIGTIEHMVVAISMARTPEELDEVFQATSGQVLQNYSGHLEREFLAWLQKPSWLPEKAVLQNFIDTWRFHDAYDDGRDDAKKRYVFNQVAHDIRMHLRLAELIAPLRGDVVDARMEIFLEEAMALPPYKPSNTKVMCELFIKASEKIQAEAEQLPVLIDQRKAKLPELMS